MSNIETFPSHDARGQCKSVNADCKCFLSEGIFKYKDKEHCILYVMLTLIDIVMKIRICPWLGHFGSNIFIRGDVAATLFLIYSKNDVICLEGGNILEANS